MAKTSPTQNTVAVESVKDGRVLFKDGRDYSVVELQGMNNPYGRGYVAHLAKASKPEKEKPRSRGATAGRAKKN